MNDKDSLDFENGEVSHTSTNSCVDLSGYDIVEEIEAVRAMLSDKELNPSLSIVGFNDAKVHFSNHLSDSQFGQLLRNCLWMSEKDNILLEFIQYQELNSCISFLLFLCNQPNVYLQISALNVIGQLHPFNHQIATILPVVLSKLSSHSSSVQLTAIASLASLSCGDADYHPARREAERHILEQRGGGHCGAQGTGRPPPRFNIDSSLHAG